MANKQDKKLIGLATGKKPPVKKETVVVEKTLTVEEERDLKAKAKVKELLEGADLTPPEGSTEEPLLELSKEEKNGKEWLQEQVALLSSENTLLKNDLEAAKENYQKIFAENQRLKTGIGIQDDSALKTGVLTIFHEIQSNYLKMPGNNPSTGLPNFIIVPPAFLNRLIMYFPFLQQEKRF